MSLMEKGDWTRDTISSHAPDDGFIYCQLSTCCCCSLLLIYNILLESLNENSVLLEVTTYYCAGDNKSVIIARCEQIVSRKQTDIELRFFH